MTATRSPRPALTDIVDAIALLRTELDGVPLDRFERDIRQRWIVERGVEIISEASRRVPAAVKARHPEVAWRKVAGIGNVLRHEYDNVAAPVLWNLVRNELASLEAVCRTALADDPSP